MTLLFDIETDGLLDEMTKIHCIVIKDTETGEVESYSPDIRVVEDIPRALARLEDAPEIAGHNVIKFDIPAIQKVFPDWKPRGVVRDTIVCTRLIWPDLKEKDFEYASKHPEFPKQMIGRHSLEAWGHRLGCHKAKYEGGWEKFSEEMLRYCVQDVEVLHKLWDKCQSKNYSEQAIELEHQFQEVIFLQERHGFMFDKKAAVELYAKLSQRRLEIERELQSEIPGWYEDMKVPDHWTAGFGLPQGHCQVFQGGTKAEAIDSAKARARAAGIKLKDIWATPGPLKRKHTPFNPASRDHIARFLQEKYSWKPKVFTDGGKPQVDETVLEGLVYPEAKKLSEYFLLEKRIGQLAEGDQAWLKQERDGRLHGEVNTNGAVTGRCTHQRPNMAQVPSVKVGPDKRVLYGAEGGYGAECRALFIAAPGYRLVGCDASSLEARCLAHFMARWDNGAYAKELLEGDIHTANMKAAGLPTRITAKTFLYAYLYGAGDAKIGSIVGKGAAEGKRLKKQFLEKTPALARLKEAIASAVRERGYLIGLDGRHLPVRSEHSALNTLLQSAGALIVKQATVFLHNDLLALGWTFGNEWAQVLHCHDEIQSEVKEDLADAYGKLAVVAMRRAGEHFGFRCPIDAEYKIGTNWCQTH